MTEFFLLDCNNFFVSCERVFNPKLEKRPVVVLSHHEGVIVARSQEAKALGIGMGVPFFQVRDLCRQQNVIALASNFALYGDMSARVMCSLKRVAPRVEVYSIDEAFLRFDAPLKDAEGYAQELQRKIKQDLGLPVSLGIAVTKTLAKMAGALAKKSPAGIARMHAWEAFPVGEIWGVGSSTRSLLAAMGIYTAEQLKNSDPLWLRKRGGASLERVQRELQGIDCSSLEEEEGRQTITCSRSFSRYLESLEEIAEALSYYAASASERLRRQKSYTKALSVYLKTDKYKVMSQNYFFSVPTNNTLDIIKAAKKCLSVCYRADLLYRKCGLTLYDLVGEPMPDLFALGPSLKEQQLDRIIDFVNRKFGSGTLFFGATGITRDWKACFLGKSPAYTTRWSELATVKA